MILQSRSGDKSVRYTRVNTKITGGVEKRSDTKGAYTGCLGTGKLTASCDD